MFFHFCQTFYDPLFKHNPAAFSLLQNEITLVTYCTMKFLIAEKKHQQEKSFREMVLSVSSLV